MVSSLEWSSILSHKNDLASINETGPEDGLACEYYKILNEVKVNRKARPLVFAHIAQTLDGRIACLNGDSKWIGNQENLRHAHRMRAICDAVMVGKNTLIHDQPQLTVRHVEGRNPIKLFLEGHSTQENKYRKVCGLVSENHNLQIPWQRLDQLLAKLNELGIRSIYLEGGGKTLSYFLKKGLVDRLQVHIAPMILGSGHAAFTLPETQKISDSLTLADCDMYNINGQFMISGPVNYK